MVEYKRLPELARDRSPESRETLIAAVTEMFLAADEQQVDHVSLLFGDIVLRVLGQLEEEARVSLSHHLSEHPKAPHELMVKLAQDAVPVASPVLETSPVLTSEDLITIASRASMAHLEAIAERKELNADVTDVLVDRGDDNVLKRVAENEQAEFHPDTFEALIEKAHESPALQEALIGRSDLPEEPVRKLVPFLSDEIRKRIKALGVDNNLVQILAERAAEGVKAELKDLNASKSQAEILIDTVVDGKRRIDDAVNQFTKKDRPIDLATLLARVADMPVDMITQLMFGKADMPLIILCRANNVSNNAYRNIVKMRAKRLRLTGKELSEALDRYANMSHMEAIQALKVVKARAHKTAAAGAKS